jgi:hypothetical protein
MNREMKQINIKPKDFSDRKYYPGTDEHPFTFINQIQGIVEKIPAPLYAIIFSGLIYLISRDVKRSILIGAVVLLDYILLVLLPKLKLSFGPPTLTLILLGILRMPFLAFSFPIALTFQILGTALVIYAFYLEPHFPKEESYKVQLSGRAHSGTLRIVHLSDLHMSYFTSREARVVEKVNAFEPDLILFTGDFFNLSNQDDPQTIRDIQRFFKGLRSRHGIYGVSGSPAVDLPESLDRFPSDLGLKIIDNQSLTLSLGSIDLRLLGLSCTQQPDPDAERLAEIMQADENRQPDATILLYHAPDIAPHISGRPIDLQLSGHTHGGQVRIHLLGPIFTGSLYGLRFTSGYYQINHGIRLILSRGLGLEGKAAPRVRFLSPPEIGLITIEISQDTVE